MATQRIDATSDVAAVKVEAGNRLRFSFDIRTDATSFDREGDALVITLKDGRKVVLEDFFVVVKGGDELPVFVLDDATEVASADFLLSMNPDLDVTASGKTSGGIEEYAADTDALAEWTDVLGKAETDTWSSGVSAPDPILSPEYVSLATSYSGTTSSGWSPPPASGGATIIPQLPPDDPSLSPAERPNDPSLPPDDRPDNPSLPETPDGPVMRANVGRFVFSRDNAGSENFQHVLRNDGEGVQLRGVLDAAGNVVTLAELAELSEGEGNGLETMTGRLFIKDGTLVFQPKSGAGAGDTEIVTYVGEDAEGNAYTRNVEIRFTDKADEFISDDAVDTYYVCTHNGAAYHVTNDADLRLGAGSDLVIMEGFQVGKSKWTINVGSGDNAVALKSATSMANSSSTMNVNSGTGNDTIAIEASAEYVAVNASTVSVNAGAGDDSVSVTSGYIMTRSESTMMNIQAGAGNDTIALDASRSVAFEGSQVVVDAGVGDDDISVNSDRHTADFNASMTVLAGDGNDTIALVTAQSAAYGRSTVTVDAGGGVDDISVTSVGHIADSRASMTVLAGDGNDAIALETAQSVASGQSTVTVAGGEGDDSVSVKSLGDYMASGKSSVDVDAGDGNDTIALETTGDMADGTSTVTVNGGIGNDLIEMRGGHSNGGVLLTGGDGADIFSFGGAELPGNTISGSFVITDFNAGEGDRLQLKNLLPPEAEENLDQYLSIVRFGSNNEDLLLTINKSSVAATNLEVRLEGVLADGGSMNGMDDTAINELITSHTIIQNSGG